MCNKAKDQGITQADAPTGQSEPWPRKRELTPEQYYAFVYGDEMKVARQKAVERFARIAPAEAGHQISDILAHLTYATIGAFFTFDEEAVARYVSERHPQFRAQMAAEHLAMRLRELGIDAQVVAQGINDAVPADSR